MLGAANVVSLIPVRHAHVDAAKSFYGETLGLRLIADDDFAVVFDVNGGVLRLTKMDEFTPQPFSVIAWQVEDIGAKVQALVERGVVFERYGFMQQDELGIWTVPDGSAKVAWFKDPQGNVLSMVDSSGTM